jgi:hypothetical protein
MSDAFIEKLEASECLKGRGFSRTVKTKKIRSFSSTSIQKAASAVFKTLS